MVLLGVDFIIAAVIGTRALQSSGSVRRQQDPLCANCVCWRRAWVFEPTQIVRQTKALGELTSVGTRVDGHLVIPRKKYNLLFFNHIICSTFDKYVQLSETHVHTL